MMTLDNILDKLPRSRSAIVSRLNEDTSSNETFARLQKEMIKDKDGKFEQLQEQLQQKMQSQDNVFEGEFTTK